ncbi:Oidioi.mRNA.OKI2018_I69.XSR.g14122.t1.cds [Oikopleura dioica]|uniref:Oidioi.mRNA.OKI2018_I69.XSR.g14122.t1.cds n=1 Tax=Oikopleura dioica TaxID=34765 RepID=A0ABN7S8U8_OIKDI|nr:Oidioi.mRNA.OKI2018_I69.XSR.g14122.t1.cds [Oikopleura dioica]
MEHQNEQQHESDLSFHNFKKTKTIEKCIQLEYFIWTQNCRIMPQLTRFVENYERDRLDYVRKLRIFDETVPMPHNTLPPSSLEVRNKEVIEESRSDLAKRKRQFFEEDSNAVIDYIAEATRKYGFREQRALVQCARDEREAELSQNLSEQLASTVEEALADSLETQLRCDITLSSDPIPEYDDEMDSFVRAALVGKNSNDIVAEISPLFITKDHLSSLNGTRWVDGEVINLYAKLIEQRSLQNPAMLRVHSFNSFLYPKLQEAGHAAVKRWTRKCNIFKTDIILFPIHIGGTHWTLAFADTRKKVLRYCDSMGGHNPKCLSILLEYLKTEHEVKQNCPLGDDWKTESISGKVPQQKNTNDCGVFVMTFSEYVSRDAAFDFSQDDMPNLRKLIKFELLQEKLLR